MLPFDVAPTSAPMPAGTPDLASYDVILVNTSAGKDSQAMLSHVVRLAEQAGVRDRVIAVHCDLGRVEWQGTRELAERQCALLEVPLRIVRRAKGDLLEHVSSRGKWPGMGPTRYCTSDHKRTPVSTLITALVAERGLGGAHDRQARVLNCLGLRAAEGSARRKRAPFTPAIRGSSGRRQIDEWLPIHPWSVDDVWSEIRASGLPHHPAYDLGMPRLSCVFCIYASRDALLLSGEHNRDLLDTYVQVEDQIGHAFTQDGKRKLVFLRTIRDDLDRGVRATLPIKTWGDM